MKKSKKGILILIPFFSPNIGGVETHLGNLVSILDKKGSRVFVQAYSPLTTENTPWGGACFTNWIIIPFWIFCISRHIFFVLSLFYGYQLAKIDIIHAQGLNA